MKQDIKSNGQSEGFNYINEFIHGELIEENKQS